CAGDLLPRADPLERAPRARQADGAGNGDPARFLDSSGTGHGHPGPSALVGGVEAAATRLRGTAHGLYARGSPFGQPVAAPGGEDRAPPRYQRAVPSTHAVDDRRVGAQQARTRIAGVVRAHRGAYACSRHDVERGGAAVTYSVVAPQSGANGGVT